MNTKISAEKAFDILKEKGSLKNFHVEGKLEFESNEIYDKAILIENCFIEYFSGSVTQFKEKVSFINSNFNECKFIFTYFLGGLHIENCDFENYLDFQASGHNTENNEIIIINNNFKDFVNFFDCWFESGVSITQNNFQKGTNLLGKPYDIPVEFDVKPIIKKNIGKIDFDNEGIKV